MYLFFFFKQKTAYEMRISDWSSDVCSSDLQVLESFAFREEIEQIQQMRDAGIVSEDLARNLRIETENVHASRRPMATVDMRATTPELLCGFPVFKDLDDAELKRVAKRLQERVFGPDAFVFRLGDRGDGMYFIASGAEIGRAACRERGWQYV